MTRLARALSWPSSWSLLIGVCLLTWLLGLSLALPYGTSRATHQWEEQATSYVVIALPQQNDKIDALQHAVSATFPGTEVTRLSEQEVAQTLAHWSTPWPGPLPTLITLHYRGDIAMLTTLARRYDPDAMVIPPPHQLEKLAPFLANIRQTACRIALAMGGAIALIAPALLYLMARTTALANTQQRLLLLSLGGNPTTLHHIFARRLALISGLGSLIGIALLLPTFIALTRALRPLLRLPPLTDPLHFTTLLPPILWGSLALLPVLIMCLSGGLVYLLCRMQDRTTS